MEQSSISIPYVTDWPETSSPLTNSNLNLEMTIPSPEYNSLNEFFGYDNNQMEGGLPITSSLTTAENELNFILSSHNSTRTSNSPSSYLSPTQEFQSSSVIGNYYYSNENSDESFENSTLSLFQDNLSSQIFDQSIDLHAIIYQSLSSSESSSFPSREASVMTMPNSSPSTYSQQQQENQPQQSVHGIFTEQHQQYPMIQIQSNSPPFSDYTIEPNQLMNSNNNTIIMNGSFIPFTSQSNNMTQEHPSMMAFHQSQHFNPVQNHHHYQQQQPNMLRQESVFHHPERSFITHHHHRSQQNYPTQSHLSNHHHHNHHHKSHSRSHHKKIESDEILLSMNKFELEQNGWTSFWPRDEKSFKPNLESMILTKRKRHHHHHSHHSRSHSRSHSHSTKGKGKEELNQSYANANGVPIVFENQLHSEHHQHYQRHHEYQHQHHQHHYENQHQQDYPPPPPQQQQTPFPPAQKQEKIEYYHNNLIDKNRLFVEIKNQIQKIPKNSDPSRFQSNGRCLIACESCKRRKMRCTNEFPTCSNCIKRGTSCKYANKVRTRGRAKSATMTTSGGDAETPVNNNPSSSSIWDTNFASSIPSDNSISSILVQKPTITKKRKTYHKNTSSKGEGQIQT